MLRKHEIQLNVISLNYALCNFFCAVRLVQFEVDKHE